MVDEPNRVVLVTGACGFAGWNLRRLSHPGQTIVPVGHRNVGKGIRRCDLTDYREVKALFSAVRPNAVIHLAAIADPNQCEKYPAASRRLNVDAAVSVAKLCEEYNAKLVFASTDLVFSGNKAPYKESDPPAPLSRYGEQKADAEEGILKRCRRATVCRLPLMFGDSSPYSANFLHPLLHALENGKKPALFVDEFRTPTGVLSVAEGLLSALHCNHRILHLGGPERVSRYDFGIAVAQVTGYSESAIEPIRQGDLAMPAPRPRDVSLDSTLAYGIGYAPQSVLSELKRLRCIGSVRKSRFLHD